LKLLLCETGFSWKAGYFITPAPCQVSENCAVFSPPRGQGHAVACFDYTKTTQINQGERLEWKSI
jgi:hypothetical protein